MNIVLFNDNILVNELQDDLVANGTVVRYDPDSPYMFSEVLVVSNEANEKGINVGDVVVIKRYAKEEYLPGQYFVSFKDVRGKMTLDEYNKMCLVD